jgi:hypothetical protein
VNHCSKRYKGKLHLNVLNDVLTHQYINDKVNNCTKSFFSIQSSEKNEYNFFSKHFECNNSMKKGFIDNYIKVSDRVHSCVSLSLTSESSIRTLLVNVLPNHPLFEIDCVGGVGYVFM